MKRLVSKSTWFAALPWLLVAGIGPSTWLIAVAGLDGVLQCILEVVAVMVLLLGAIEIQWACESRRKGATR